jgi:hypothetical protein
LKALFSFLGVVLAVPLVTVRSCLNPVLRTIANKRTTRKYHAR